MGDISPIFSVINRYCHNYDFSFARQCLTTVTKERLSVTPQLLVDLEAPIPVPLVEETLRLLSNPKIFVQQSRSF